MKEGVVADVMAVPGDLGQGLPVFFERCVLANDKKRDFELEGIEAFEDPGDERLEVRGEFFPAGIAVRFHIGPLVVQVDRQTGEWFGVIHGIESSSPFRRKIPGPVWPAGKNALDKEEDESRAPDPESGSRSGMSGPIFEPHESQAG